MNSDLHLHTKYSDGELNEFEIIDAVLKANIQEFAICDHDTIEGSEKVFEILKNSNPYNLVFHSGVELSCRVNEYMGGINVHLLVRDFDYDDEALKNYLSTTKNFRKIKLDIMLEKVKEVYGIEFLEEEIKNLVKSTNTIGKPHIYKLLSTHGNFDKEEFYQKLGGLKTEHLKLDASDVCEKMTHKSSYVTLAHPKEIMMEYNLTYDDIENIVKILIPHGLKAIETKHSLHTFDDYVEFYKIAEKYNLKETVGSDFHGEHVKPGLKIGDIEKK